MHYFIQQFVTLSLISETKSSYVEIKITSYISGKSESAYLNNNLNVRISSFIEIRKFIIREWFF